MKKCKLKKEMPFAKIGNVAGIDGGGSTYYLADNGIKIFFGIGLSELIKVGWVEEIKPRELYISKSVIRDYAKEKPEDFFYPQRNDLVKIKEVFE